MMDKSMKEEAMYILKLNKYDYGIIMNTLNDKRNELLEKGHDTEIIDDVLYKVIEAQERQKGVRNERGR